MQNQALSAEIEIACFVREHEGKSEFVVTGTDFDGASSELIFKIKNTLKNSIHSEVLLATFDDKPVIIKHFFADDAQRIVQETEAEIARVQQSMSGGAYQIHNCLFAFPEIGVLVFDYFNGVRLSDALRAAPPSERARLLSSSGLWLKHYGETRNEKSGIKWPYWKKKLLTKNKVELCDPDDEILQEKLRMNLLTRANGLKGFQVKRSILHDDFLPINILSRKDQLCGIDIHASSIKPYSLVIARFLVWLQIREPLTEAETTFGIYSADISSFLDSGILPQAEIQTILPFFIGEQLYGRFKFFDDGHKSIDPTRHAIRQFLNEKV